MRILAFVIFCLMPLSVLRATEGRPPAAKPWSALYVFGDSYSDSGAGYVDGNGATAVVYMAQTLGIPFTHVGAPDTAGKGLNFAVSGGTTGGGDGARVKDALLGRGLQTQVLDFVASVKSGAIQFNREYTLFFIAGGLNDRRLATTESVANLESLIEALHGTGARYFLLAILPEKIPGFDLVAKRLNPAIAGIPETMNRRLPGVTVRLSRWGESFDEVMLKPADYGITNTKDACAGRAIFDQDTTPAGPPDRYYYYHAGHPSTAVQRIVGAGLVREARTFEKKR